MRVKTPQFFELLLCVAVVEVVVVVTDDDADSLPNKRAMEGTTARVIPNRMGSVNFVMIQAIANVPTLGFSRIKPGSLVLPVTFSTMSQNFFTDSMGSRPNVDARNKSKSKAMKIELKVVTYKLT